MLQNLLKEKIDRIHTLLGEIEPFEAERIESQSRLHEKNKRTSGD